MGEASTKVFQSNLYISTSAKIDGVYAKMYCILDHLSGDLDIEAAPNRVLQFAKGVVCEEAQFSITKTVKI